MVTFCALHDVEAKEKEEVMAVEGHGKALKAVNLDEPRVQVHLGRVGDEQEQRWYLDSGVSNHMTGSKEAFSELDGNVTDTVKFGDGSRMAIRGRGTIIFSISQLDEYDNEVLIKDDVLRIRDREQRLLAKVKRSQNRLYLHGTRTSRGYGMPGELCDSCLAGKQRRLPFPKTEKYRAAEALELVHGDLCGPITSATHGERKYFILLVDDCSRFMWLQLLTSKTEAAEAVKKFKARAEVESGKKLRVLRTDRGGEFTSVEFVATFGCVSHVKKTKPHIDKLEDRSTPVVLLDYEEGTKAYRLYDPKRGKVVISRDVVFDEMAAWDREGLGTREAGSLSSYLRRRTFSHPQWWRR
ncbi:uncharacterized protein [Miscanthus floridulus]|uniref:uncharacterized protein n=1 Tax=Miscanthus floridulus TaxID=154761 RepID=UPI00345A1777